MCSQVANPDLNVHVCRFTLVEVGNTSGHVEPVLICPNTTWGCSCAFLIHDKCSITTQLTLKFTPTPPYVTYSVMQLTAVVSTLSVAYIHRASCSIALPHRGWFFAKFCILLLEPHTR